MMLMSARWTPPRFERACSSAPQHHQICSSRAAGGAQLSTLHGTAEKSQRVNLDTHAAVFWLKKPIQVYIEATLLFAGRIFLDMGFILKSTHARSWRI